MLINFSRLYIVKKLEWIKNEENNIGSVHAGSTGHARNGGTGWAVLRGTGSFETWKWVVLPPRPAPLEVE